MTARARIANGITYAIRWTYEHLPQGAQVWVDNGAQWYWTPPNRAYWLVEKVACGWFGCVWEPMFRHDRDQWPVELICFNCVGTWSSDDPEMFEPGTREHRRVWEVVGDTLFEAADTYYDRIVWDSITESFVPRLVALRNARDAREGGAA